MKFAYLATCMVVALLMSANADASTMTLIGDAIGSGNGEFFYESAGQATPTGGTSGFEEIFTRDRGLVQASGVGTGLSTADWRIRRVSYSSGNAALGTDGLYGLAPGAGTGAGQSGQAFVNSGVIDVIFNDIALSGNVGDEYDLSYRIGSDGSNGATIEGTLIFDNGLVSESSVALGGDFTMNAGGDAIAKSYTTTAAYSTVTLVMNIATGNGNGNRGLLDSVQLSVALVPEPASAALCLLGLAGVLVRRRS